MVPQGSHSGHFTPNRGTGNRSCVCLTGSELSVVRMDENRLGIQETVGVCKQMTVVGEESLRSSGTWSTKELIK